MEDTISAIATAVGEGGIGIVRISGPRAIAIAERLFVSGRHHHCDDICTRQAVYGSIIDPVTGEVVDEAILLIMRAPHSYTREDVVEIQCHGGPLPLRRILSLTLDAGARLAEPGEFTKRAFLNGRLDLTQAEAVMDIIRARTDTSLRVSVNQLQGALQDKIKSLRRRLLATTAHIEAVIDFPEDDVEGITIADIKRESQAVMRDIDILLASAHAGIILREGLKTVICGRPNVGKSSLLNALLRRERAIVTAIPGTTRDSIEEFVNIRGIPLCIVDTAGIRESDDPVEQIGVEKSRQLTAQADLELLVIDSSQELMPADCKLLTELAERQAIVVFNKTDLPTKTSFAAIKELAPATIMVRLSLVSGKGLDELEQQIVNMVYAGKALAADRPCVSNVRQASLLKEARHSLEDVLTAAAAGQPMDCLSIDLTAAVEKLGMITGDTVGEDIINEIFARFCVGK